MKTLILTILLLCMPEAFSAPANPTNPTASSAPSAPPNPAAAAVEKNLPRPSSSAQKLYSAAQDDLLQVRVLLRAGRTQSSVGSGFMVGASDLVVTNYHVVSQIALEPDTYVGEFVDTQKRRGAVELLAVDVLNDLAVLRVKRKGSGFFTLPARAADLAELTQGQYLYSLGNPLDLGFAISEGTYNGVISRSFYQQLMFTGPINSGMSGGPNVTVDGQVAGVNVARRTDGELVSFLVPARHVVALLDRVAAQGHQPLDFKVEVGRQLLAHQTELVDRLLAVPLNLKVLGTYNVPVRESDQMRCWGRSSTKPEDLFAVDDINCGMESAVFVSGQLQTGHVSVRHEFIRSLKLDAVRFSELASGAFKNESFGSRRDARLTGPACNEMFVANKSLPLRAVLCVRAYRKFSGLYDFSLLTASVDSGVASLQSRVDANGVSYDNGLRLARVFLDALGRRSAK